MKIQPALEESSESIATVWDKLPTEFQQLAIDLIVALVCDYYWFRKGEDHHCEKHRKQD